MKVEEKKCNTCNRFFREDIDYLKGTSRWRRCSLGHLWFNCSCGSTLILRQGKYSWYSADKFMSAEAASVFNKLGGLKDLPYLPHSIMQLQMMINGQDFEPENLAREIRHDPFIAASTLQVAENLRRARNPGTSPIRSMVHAIVYIGKGTLANIITSAAIKNLKLPPSEFNQRQFWQESYLTGAVSEVLASKIAPNIERDEAYIAGTLANIGKLVTAVCFPALITKVSNDINDVKKLPTWRQAEASYKFPEHTILGEIAASLWGLPGFVMDTVRHHHTMPKPEEMASSQEVKLEWVVGLSNQLTHWILSQPSRIEMDLLEVLRTTFHLSESDLEDFVSDLLPLRDSVESEIEANPEPPI